MKWKIKNRLHRNDINRPTPRHGHKYIKYKKCLSMKILQYIKKLSNTKAELKKSVAYENKSL